MEKNKDASVNYEPGKYEFLKNHPGVSKVDHEYNEELWQKYKANQEHLLKQEIVKERQRLHEEYMKQEKVERERHSEHVLKKSDYGPGIKVEPKLLEDILYRMQELISQNRSLGVSITTRLNAFYDSGEDDPAHWETPNTNNYFGFLSKMDHLNNMLLINNEMLINTDEKLKRLI